MQRRPARALLVDLDGVLRRWDPAAAAAAESAAGLAAGTLLATATDWELYRPAVSGELTDAEWMRLVAQRLPLPEAEAAAAVARWQEHRGTVDPDVLGFVRAARAAGRRVGIATNATDRLDADLAALGLAGETDVVVSSARLGIHKPAPEFFARACEALGEDPRWTLFVDDEDRVIRGARAAGLLAYRWSGPDGLPYLWAALGLADAPARRAG